MIDPEDIYCNSSLHDSCGVVFQHQGRVYRALHERGARIFAHLSQDNWSELLWGIGLVRLKRTDFQIPGYHGVIECEGIRPVLPPGMWTTSMLRDAALRICELSKELLKRGLVLWDLKGMANMTFSAQRGPVFLDMGAIHTVDEIENHILSTSFDSLFEQSVSSFYVPLWLTYGPLKRLRPVKQFLKYYMAGGTSSALTTGLLRRLTMGWRAVPGLRKAKKLLNSRQYIKFYEFISHQINSWCFEGIVEAENKEKAMDNTPPLGTAVNGLEVVRIMGDRLREMENKILFDLCPEEKIGQIIGENDDFNVYLLTKQHSKAEEYWGWRKRKGKAILPVLCDIWDRSLHPCFDLENASDMVFLLPNVIKTAALAKVPLDFVGRVLSLLTKKIAVVGIDKNWENVTFPCFISPVRNGDNPVNFCRTVLGKYFKSQEIISLSERPGAFLLILHK